MSEVKMKEPASVIPKFDDETKDLELLLDAFGSVISLKDIASAYCQAQRDIYVASEILCNIQGSTSGASNCTSMDELESNSVSSECPEDNWFDKSNLQEKDVESKQKKYTASAGSVSGVIGREYARFKTSRNESCEPMKPLKLNSEEFPASQIWNEEVQSDITTDGVHKDLEDFLFKMLGEGFELDMTIIKQVLGFCGYNVEKSMEKLLDLSASTLGNIDGVSGRPSQNLLKQSTERYMETESFPGLEEIKSMKSSRSDKAKTIPGNGFSKKKDKNVLQKQLLQSLFTAPDRFEEEPKKFLPPKPYSGSRASIKVVTEPLRDPVIERLTPAVTLTGATGENEEDERGYQGLRKAVKEYWRAMAQYYKAAADAFSQGDHKRANKFLEEGKFFQKKAREADEASAQKFLRPK